MSYGNCLFIQSGSVSRRSKLNSAIKRFDTNVKANDLLKVRYDTVASSCTIPRPYLTIRRLNPIDASAKYANALTVLEENNGTQGGVIDEGDCSTMKKRRCAPSSMNFQFIHLPASRDLDRVEHCSLQSLPLLMFFP